MSSDRGAEMRSCSTSQCSFILTSVEGFAQGSYMAFIFKRLLCEDNHSWQGKEGVRKRASKEEATEVAHVRAAKDLGYGG